ncbi:hypothetical protein [Mesorhizobium sp. M7A.F.Ca.MR.148.00.0.0]|uniref:hypothetical protein n=1 Tax=Mesorhizobium sp. M7A.F.Ca.MR.148.00.0.0 TaxID=2496775 RepID=UPI000FCAB388|nr:hypothetical protein [Mesorhizobium sp. M7A.F.Ca.MR.148.00.0.0]RUV33826.1 hypothetical protein EOB49_28670 [Mesorhizobium sp. M7A.F.Ca.MR.148.00.0.0]
MTFRLLTLIAVGLAAGLAAWRVDLQDLFLGFQPTTVALSIMAAAVLVRLNRGMPTLDWKSLEPKGRKNLTAKIVKLQQEYLSILLINVVLVGVLIYLVVVTPPVVALWPEKVRRLMSGLLAGGMVLALARMGLVVWRDYDIVRLQKVLIDGSADKEFQATQEEAAEKRLSAMKGLRQVDGPPVVEWDASSTEGR